MLSLGLICNIGALSVLKYYNFFISSVNLIWHKDFNLIHLFLPLGISFYTFLFIALLIDCSPHPDLQMINALAASDHAIIPIQAHYLDEEGRTLLSRADCWKTLKFGPTKMGTRY